MMQKAGRKRKQARTHVDVFMSKQVHERVKEYAAAADLPISTWIRHVFVAELDRSSKRKQT